MTEVKIGSICQREDEVFVVRAKFRKKWKGESVWHYRLSRRGEIRQGGPIPEPTFRQFFTVIGFDRGVAEEEAFVTRCYERLALLRTSEQGRRLPRLAGNDNATIRDNLKTRVFKQLPRNVSDADIDGAILSFLDH